MLLVTVGLVEFGGVLAHLTLILYTLELRESARLVGLVVLASWLPGILMSPIAGMLLDARRRAPLVVLDCCVAAASMFAIVVSATAGVMTPWLLLTIVGLSSLTAPFSDSGLRTLLAVVPKPALWDRANAVESALVSVMRTVASALAGLLVGVGAGIGGFAVAGAFILVAGINLLRLREPIPERKPRSPRSAALAELRGAWRERNVRSVAVTAFIDNLAIGVLQVALPVWLLDRFGVTGLIAGLVWSFFNLASFGVTLRLGVAGTAGREGRVIAIGLALQIVGFLLLLVAGAQWWILICMMIAGASIGTIDVALFSLLQRSVDPDRLGRANALTLMVTSLGIPIGAALGGIVAAASATGALLVAPALVAGATAVCLLTIGRGRGIRGGAYAAGRSTAWTDRILR